MEAEFNHLNHATWECKYRVVFPSGARRRRKRDDIRTENLVVIWIDIGRHATPA
jgi:hypothetical protein